MSVFSYRAYDAKGQLVEGKTEGVSRDAVLSDLRRRGAFPVEIAELQAAGRQQASGTRAQLSRDVLVLITRELATLIEAHLPIDEALRIVALQPQVPARARKVLDAVRGEVEAGHSLSGALLATGTFPTYYVSLIAAAERGATLGPALTGLAGYLERRADIARRVQGALLYPVILTVAAVAALGVVIGVLVPAVAPLFDEAGVSPPPAIALLRAVHVGLAAHWPVVLVSICGLVLLGVQAVRSPARRARLDRLMLRLPFAGRMIAHGQTARLAQTLATLLQNGVPLLDALRVTARALDSAPYRDAANEISDHVSRGGTFAAGLAASGCFSPLAVRLAEIGERTGELQAMLARLGRIEEDALSKGLERALALLAPVLTVLVGILVGGILVSVMSAILSLNDVVAR